MDDLLYLVFEQPFVSGFLFRGVMINIRRALKKKKAE